MKCYRCCKLWNKVRVFFGFKRKLCGSWTVERVKALKATHGLDVEEELTKILTEEIEKEIKKEIKRIKGK